MERDSIARCAALIAGAACVGAACHAAPWWACVPLLAPFFHTGWLHCLLNVWCLLGLVFACGARWRAMAVAWLAAAAFPYCLQSLPTVGLSGVCWAIMGWLTPRVRRRGLWWLTVAAWTALGLIMPGVNAWLHLWCFAAGLLLWRV